MTLYETLSGNPSPLFRSGSPEQASLSRLRQELFRELRKRGGCGDHCAVYSFVDLPDPAIVVRHIMGANKKVDDLRLDDVPETSSDAIEQKVAAWLLKLHGKEN